MTIGGTNSSLYTGNINFISLTQAQYWMIPMTSINVGTQAITLSGANQNAVIDTGTTLIGGPRSVLTSLYAQVPGAAPGTSLSSSLADYFLIPCNTQTVVSLTFGGISYQISPKDFIVDQISTSYCLAAFFILELSGSSPIPGQSSSNPTWVVGDSFLKNVYTVFRADPPSVGFANLSSVDGGIGLAGSEITNGTTTIVSSNNNHQFTGGAVSTGVALCTLFGAVTAAIVGLSL
jgi:cathepsin D